MKNYIAVIEAHQDRIVLDGCYYSVNEIRKALAAIGPAQQPEASGSVDTPKLHRCEVNTSEEIYLTEEIAGSGDFVAYDEVMAWHAAGVAAETKRCDEISQGRERHWAQQNERCGELMQEAIKRAEKAEAELEEWEFTNRIDELHRALDDWMQSSRDWKARAEQAEAERDEARRELAEYLAMDEEKNKFLSHLKSTHERIKDWPSWKKDLWPDDNQDVKPEASNNALAITALKQALKELRYLEIILHRKTISLPSTIRDCQETLDILEGNVNG